MDVNDVFGNIQIYPLVALIENHEEHIEPAHDRRTHSKVCSEGLLSVVSPADGVRSS